MQWVVDANRAISGSLSGAAKQAMTRHKRAIAQDRLRLRAGGVLRQAERILAISSRVGSLHIIPSVNITYA